MAVNIGEPVSFHAWIQVLVAGICLSAYACNSCNEHFQRDFTHVRVSRYHVHLPKHRSSILLLSCSCHALLSYDQLRICTSTAILHIMFPPPCTPSRERSCGRWRPHLHNHRQPPPHHPSLPTLLNSLVIIVCFIKF